MVYDRWGVPLASLMPIPYRSHVHVDCALALLPLEMGDWQTCSCHRIRHPAPVPRAQGGSAQVVFGYISMVNQAPPWGECLVAATHVPQPWGVRALWGDDSSMDTHAAIRANLLEQKRIESHDRRQQPGIRGGKTRS